MINLLPENEKEKILMEKNRKLVIIFGIVAVVSLLCLALILLSIKFYILAETDAQKNILGQIKGENQTADFINMNNTVKKYNGLLAQLNSFYKNELYFSQVIDIINSVQKPAGLYFKNYSFERNKEGIKVNISGFSDKRENLLTFKNNIEKNNKIKNSSFSQDSWINPTNISFNLSFDIKNGQQ